MRIKTIIKLLSTMIFCLDITPNSQEQPTKKCMVISKENQLSDLGSERVKQ